MQTIYNYFSTWVKEQKLFYKEKVLCYVVVKVRAGAENSSTESFD